MSNLLPEEEIWKEETVPFEMLKKAQHYFFLNRSFFQIKIKNSHFYFFQTKSFGELGV